MKTTILRYIITLIITIFSNIFYSIFTPLTIYPTYAILSLTQTTTLTNTTLTFNGTQFTFIPACIAGTAYLVLTILVLTTKGIKPIERIKALLTGYLLLLLLNITRILTLIFIYTFISEQLFHTLHLIFWHILSTIFVLLIWILLTKLYKIKQIPIYSDIKHLLKKVQHT